MARRAVNPRPPAAVKKVEKAPAAFHGAIGLRIAGLGLNFRAAQGGKKSISGSAGIISILRKRYGRFSSGDGKAIQLEVYRVEGRREPFEPVVTSFGSSLEIKRGDFSAWITLRHGTGNFAATASSQCLDAFLRSFISFMLIRSGGFMLHSAGLVKGGRAYIFLGKSGAGKSTLSKLAASGPHPRSGAGVEVISDEINLLRFEKGRFRVYGSPFWGEMRADGRQGSWPLGGIFLLKKAKTNRLSPCSKPEALKLLLRCLVNFDVNPVTAEQVLANASCLLKKTRFVRLAFSKADSGFLSFLKAGRLKPGSV